MSFLNRQFNSCYEELIRYYPRYYRDVREMVAILKAHGSVCDTLEDNVEQVYNNNFIDTMDEATITRLEKFLGIALNKSRTLEERRRMVKAYFAGFGTISASAIQEMIYTYTGAEVEVTFEPFDDEGNNMLIINIARGDEETIYMSDILLLLSKKIPAHIEYRADLWYDFPGIAIGGGRKRRSYWKHDFLLSGTIPDNTLIGDINAITSVIDRSTTAVKSTYSQTAEDGLISGVEPITIQAGKVYGISTETDAQVSAAGIDYIYCGEEYASAE